MTSFKIILILFLLALACHLTACHQNRQPDLVFTGGANNFVQTEKRAFGGVEAIENSFVKINGELFAFFDPAATGELRKRNMKTGETKSVGKGMRFNYVIEEGEKLFAFYSLLGGIWRAESDDAGETWGNARQVIYEDFVTWNPGAVKDKNGKWHLLVEGDETGKPGQAGVACYWYTSLDGDSWTPQGKLIDHCGNAHLVSVVGGLLVIHGDFSTGTWQTTISTFDENKNEWKTHRNQFLIASPGVHVCDPSAIEESDGTILLSVSVDQNSITLTKGIGTFQELFERLTQ